MFVEGTGVSAMIASARRASPSCQIAGSGAASGGTASMRMRGANKVVVRDRAAA